MTWQPQRTLSLSSVRLPRPPSPAPGDSEYSLFWRDEGHAEGIGPGQRPPQGSVPRFTPEELGDPGQAMRTSGLSLMASEAQMRACEWQRAGQKLDVGQGVRKRQGPGQSKQPELEGGRAKPLFR